VKKEGKKKKKKKKKPQRQTEHWRPDDRGFAACAPSRAALCSMCRGQTHRPTTQKKKDQGPPSFPSLFENKKKKEKYFSMQTGPQKCLKFNFFLVIAFYNKKKVKVF
jgi:hypothetical protein